MTPLLALELPARDLLSRRAVKVNALSCQRWVGSNWERLREYPAPTNPHAPNPSSTQLLGSGAPTTYACTGLPFASVKEKSIRKAPLAFGESTKGVASLTEEPRF